MGCNSYTEEEAAAERNTPWRHGSPQMTTPDMDSLDMPNGNPSAAAKSAANGEALLVDVDLLRACTPGGGRWHGDKAILRAHVRHGLIASSRVNPVLSSHRLTKKGRQILAEAGGER